MSHNTTSVTKIRIEFLRGSTLFTSHHTMVKCESDIVGALAEAYARFHAEHPDVSALDGQILISRSYKVV